MSVKLTTKKELVPAYGDVGSAYRIVDRLGLTVEPVPGGDGRRRSDRRSRPDRMVPRRRHSHRSRSRPSPGGQGRIGLQCPARLTGPRGLPSIVAARVLHRLEQPPPLLLAWHASAVADRVRLAAGGSCQVARRGRYGRAPLPRQKGFRLDTPPEQSLSPISESRKCPRCGEDRAAEEFARDGTKASDLRVSASPATTRSRSVTTKPTAST